MGKKSRNPSKLKAAKADKERGEPEPMDLGPMKTSNPALQLKLDELAALAAAADKEAFVKAFVPLDLSEAELNGYLGDLTTGPEADGAWANLSSEIQAIAAGTGVWKIEGDQTTSAVFYFPHPLLGNCDREVEFKCVNGEWRADG